MRFALALTAALLAAPAAVAAQSTHAEVDRERLAARSAAVSAWQEMAPAERASASRRETRARRRAFKRASADASAKGPASELGRWEAPFAISSNFRGYAIHAALLRTGKVLFYGYPLRPEHPGFRGNETYAWLWNPKKGRGKRAFKEIIPRDSTGANASIYCSGMSFLSDGRLLVVGGNLKWPKEDPADAYDDYAGLNRAFLFDPIAEKWTELPRPEGSHGRWYPSQALLPDGRSLVISGFTEEAPGATLNQDLEIYEPPTKANPTGTFQLLTGEAQRRDTELYPHLFVMPDGKLRVAGPDVTDTAIFDPNNLTAPWTQLPNQAVQRIGGNAVLMPGGPAGSYRVLQLAGAPYDAATLNTTEQIDFSAPFPTWSPGPPLNVPRAYPNTVLLPDRSLVVVGGTDRAFGDHEYTPRGRQVELLPRGGSAFTVGPQQVEERGYHSTGLLLPDGTVLSAGDDLSPTQDGTYATSSPFDTAEIYRPAYLYKGQRPVITKAPKTARYGRTIKFKTPSRVKSVVLAAPSAVTHSVDMSQRIVPLRITGRRRGKDVTAVAPPTAAVAPPGWYMLFAVDGQGRPSVARFVRLR